jgi:predicted lipid carrier protein YhbT
MLHTAPAGPSIHVHCTDTEGEWLVQLPADGERVVTREHAKADVALRGPAEGLLLMLWGRLDSAAADLEVIGDTDVVNRWVELFPSM